MDLQNKIALDAQRINQKTAEQKQNITQYFNILLQRSINSNDVESAVYYREVLNLL